MGIVAPIQESIKAIQHDPEYTLHRYFARRPHNVINHVIQHYISGKNALVYDPFGGGGTTLYESLICGHRAIACDTSDLACFIMEQEALMSGADTEILSQFVDHIMDELSFLFSPIYSYHGKEMYWLEWSTYTACPSCEKKVLLSPFNTLGSGKYRCETCGREFKPVGINVNCVQPVEICLMEKGSLRKGQPSNQTREKDTAGELDRFYESVLKTLKELGYGGSMEPNTPIPDCNLQRESALHKKGILHYEQFIPTATRAVITYIGNFILSSELSELMKEQLLFVLSASLRYCSRFSSLNQAWRGDRPMEWAKSNFWTPYTFVEVNPVIAFYERWSNYLAAVNSAKKKFSVAPTKGTCQEVIAGKRRFSVLNQSSEHVEEMPDESVDLVVTDPPYGSYLHYGELSAFWTTWLSRFLPRIHAVPSRRDEAVPARKKGYPGWKSFWQYEMILSKSFSEAYRVLKNGQYCVVTFNNKEPEAWISFLRAVKRAGFILPKDGIVFQDGVESYKKSIDSRRGGAIFGDFIYSFRKDVNTRPVANTIHADWKENLDKSLKELSETEKEIPNVALYTKIYLRLLPELFEAIDADDINTDYLMGLTFKNFEGKIAEYYSYSDGIWSKK